MYDCHAVDYLDRIGFNRPRGRMSNLELINTVFTSVVCIIINLPITLNYQN